MADLRFGVLKESSTEACASSFVRKTTISRPPLSSKFGYNPPVWLSEGLRAVIGKRLSHLSPNTNRLLSIAAVVGRDFRLQTLRVVASMDDEHLIASLEEAVKIGVLEERQQVGGVQYRFAHAFRQTLYEGLQRRSPLQVPVMPSRDSKHAAEKSNKGCGVSANLARKKSSRESWLVDPSICLSLLPGHFRPRHRMRRLSRLGQGQPSAMARSSSD